MSPFLISLGLMVAVPQQLQTLTSGISHRQAETAIANPTATIFRRQTVTLSASKLRSWDAESQRFNSQLNGSLQQFEGQAQAWQQLIATSSAMGAQTRLAWVNRRINAIPYVPDSRNWESSDYWATPLELMSRGGDCEDYAIAKYHLLAASGISSERMAVAVSDDHAVLLVDTGKGFIVLDSQRTKPYKLTGRFARRFNFTVNSRDWTLKVS